jgi:ribosome maturation factor RimP
MGTTPDALIAELSPIVAGLGMTLHDVEITKALIRVTIHKDGGVSLDQLAEANRAISEHLDAHEPFDGRYTLEVSSPGVERKLRRPDHFTAAIGEIVSVKTAMDVDTMPGRRVEGELIEATNDGIVVAPDDGDGTVSLHYDQIDKARTVFAWGGGAKPSPSRGGSPKRAKTPKKTPSEKVTMP